MTKSAKCTTERPEDEQLQNSNQREDESARDDAHLRDVEVGAGCTEIWEHLAEQREE